MTKTEFERQLTALSPREREVMALVAKGLKNPEIAGVLSITRKTVENTIVRANRRFEPRLSREVFIRLWWETVERTR